MEVDPRESQTRFDLPEEIWIHIFRCLDIKSVQNVQLVCKTWLEFILNDVILSGEYTFVSKDLTPSQINGVLAKRKNLKIVRFPSKSWPKKKKKWPNLLSITLCLHKKI